MLFLDAKNTRFQRKQIQFKVHFTNVKANCTQLRFEQKIQIEDTTKIVFAYFETARGNASLNNEKETETYKMFVSKLIDLIWQHLEPLLLSQ